MDISILWGFGINARTVISDNLFIGVGLYGTSTEEGKTQQPEKSQYQFSSKSFVIPLSIDYHPWSSGFKTSLILSYNDTYSSILDKTNATDLGKLKFGGSIVPAVTMGYDNSLISDDMISFNFALGISYSKNTLDLNTDGKNQESQITNDEYISMFTEHSILPVISFGVRFNF